MSATEGAKKSSDQQKFKFHASDAVVGPRVELGSANILVNGIADLKRRLLQAKTTIDVIVVVFDLAPSLLPYTPISPSPGTAHARI
jgi:hypothetical protein